MTDDDRRIGAVRDELLKRYLGFASGGLQFAPRDISAEITEARQMMVAHLGRDVQLPHRPNRFIHLWLVTGTTHEVVGRATREVGIRGSTLVVAHRQLQIRPEWRRQGFGSALLAANREWYRESGVESIVMEAEGDGSAFAAVRGFDFDVVSYARRPGFAGLSERELRFAAVHGLIRHSAISDTGNDVPGQPREPVAAFLMRLRGLGAEPAQQVDHFTRRLPRSGDPTASTLTGDDLTFTAPRAIATFGQNEPLTVLDNSSLGPAVLARTGWSGISAV